MSNQEILFVFEDLKEKLPTKLYFFLDFDLTIFGKVSTSTLKEFSKRNIPFPFELIEYL